MKHFVAVALLLAPLVTSFAADPLQPVRRPNIILILADDLGAKELSCYGSARHQTPCLDRMAAEGMRFATFYAMPLCTPTRVALMTGQYGFHNGFLGMQDPAFKPAPGSPPASIGNHFTHADLLKSQGYATALCGKWQLSGALPTLIHDAGFDEYRIGPTITTCHLGSSIRPTKAVAILLAIGSPVWWRTASTCPRSRMTSVLICSMTS